MGAMVLSSGLLTVASAGALPQLKPERSFERHRLTVSTKSCGGKPEVCGKPVNTGFGPVMTLARAPRAAAAATAAATATAAAPRASRHRRHRRRRRVDPSSRAHPPARSPRRHPPSALRTVVARTVVVVIERECTARAPMPDRASPIALGRRVASPRVARLEELANEHRDRRARVTTRRALATTTTIDRSASNRHRIGIESDNGRHHVTSHDP